MVLDLNGPLSWRPAVDAVEMLDNLQANILTPHVHDHLRVLFLNLADAFSARAFLAGLVEQALVKSARTHLAELDAFHAAQVPGSPYVGVGLTRGGYGLVAPSASPDDPAFVRGMASSRVTPTDATLRSWQPPYRQAGASSRIHAMVLVADAVEAPVLARTAQVRALIPQTATVVAREAASTLRNPDRPVERLGHGDGCYQPAFLTEDAAGAQACTPLSRVLVREPGSADDDNRFGSYLIFRKLEQNVRLFGHAAADAAGGRTDLVVQRGPSSGVGLLSMTFSSHIPADPVAANGAVPREATMRGGEYFFMPSRGFLRSL